MVNKISNAVEKHRQLILEAERYIWKNPETGYKEFKTSKYLAERYEALGYKLTYADGITGFYTVIDTGREGPEVLILGELDSVICPAHPESDPVTGAVHACGHHAQSAALLGIAAALTEEGMLDSLCGRIRLCAVPAEELLEIEYRQGLKAAGTIKYLGGKSEFLRRGYFDGVDLAFMVHTARGFSTGADHVGCIAKSITYKGRASHAGGSPQNGINALYAANCGLNAVNSLRETFYDEDYIRSHPIITHGGDMVNAIPETVTVESYVRGRSYEAITRENKKINRALTGAALSMGANIEIVDIPGYSPLVNDLNLKAVAKEAAKMVDPALDLPIGVSWSKGSTDMGDLGHIMPVVHPYAGGAIGNSHGNNYYIVDPVAACVTNAKWQIMMLYLLLGNNGERAKKILAEYKPVFASAKDFLDYQDSLNDSGDRITYKDGEAAVRI
jgi:amidohydrolase